MVGLNNRRLVTQFFVGWVLGSMGACGNHESSSPTEGSTPDASVGGTGALGTGGAKSTGGATSADSGYDPSACAATRTFSCTALDAQAVLANFSSADQAAFCDCVAAYTGGYGVQGCTCPDGTPGGLSSDSSQASCVASFGAIPQSCTVTLGEYTTCVNLLWARPCDVTSQASAVLNPSCKHMLTAPCPWS
jgi:hypothetical protein